LPEGSVQVNRRNFVFGVGLRRRSTDTRKRCAKFVDARVDRSVIDHFVVVEQRVRIAPAVAPAPCGDDRGATGDGSTVGARGRSHSTVRQGFLTWRAVRLFVPLDLLFKVLIWIGYREMLGPLDPPAAHRLTLLAIALSLPFVIGWIVGLVAVLVPIDRWLAAAARGAMDGDEDADRKRLARACRAASAAPRWFALLWMVNWVAPFALLNIIALWLQADVFGLAPHTWVGAAFMFAALPLGSISLAFTFLSWYLGPTMGQLSLAAHASGLHLVERSWSLRQRNFLVASCLGLAPVTWIASITYMSGAQAVAERNLVAADAAAQDVLVAAGTGPDARALDVAVSSRPGAFVADRSGTVLGGSGQRVLIDHPALAAWLADSAPAREGSTSDARSGWAVAFRSAGRDRVVGAVRRPERPHDLAQVGVILLFCAVVLIYALLCAGFLSGSIGRPVASIARVIRDITDARDLTEVRRIPVFQRDEIGDLVDGANRMLDRLEEAARASRAAETALRLANEELERRVVERTAELASSNRQLGLSLDELRSTQRKLVDASRLAGMAEVASVVLHNIGNVLTSVNVSARLVVELARGSRGERLVELAELLQSKSDDLPRFLGEADRSRLIPAYLVAVARHMGDERTAIQTEMARLERNLDHIQAVIRAQQKHTGRAIVVEQVVPSSLVEEALDLTLLGREHEIQIVRDLEELPAMSLDRHLVLQILINLLRNAHDAVASAPEPRIVVRMRLQSPDRFTIEVADSGTGIAPEHLDQIFNQGFTTKSQGQGLGLHSGACSATMMGGRLTASSPGPGQGATFVLELPTRVAVEEG
jgi:signal transduction histidine kinase